MKLYYNLETGVLGATASATVNVAKMVAKRYHTAEVELLPVRNGEVVPFGPAATGVLAVKTEKDFAGALKILDAVWDVPVEVDGGYKFVFLVAGVGLDAELGTEVSATFGMEITVQDGDRRFVLPTVQLVVENNYYREDEPVPEDPEVPYPLPGEIVTEAPEDGKGYVRKDGGWVEVVGGGGGSINYALKGASFSAEVGKNYACDTTEDEAFEVLLPTNPATGDVIGFADARGTWGSNPLVVLRNGKKIESAEANFVNNAAGTFFSLVYIDATTGWRVLASGTKPLNLVPPSISGSYRQTAVPGEWTGSPTSYSYQWQHSEDGLTGWENVAGATASSFTPADYEGEYVRVAVVATNANGPSAVAYSEASEAIVVPEFPTDGLVAFWKLDNLTDSSGNGNTLTNNNGVTFVAGKLGDAALCSSGYLTSGATLCNPDQAMTVAAWFKTTNSENENHFIFGDESNGSNYFFLMEHGGRLYANLGGMSQVGPSVAINDGEWHHAALVWNGATLKIYVDGAAGLSDAMGDAISPISVNVGASESGDWVFGNAIDAAGAWNRALSAEEILLLYNDGEGVEL